MIFHEADVKTILGDIIVEDILCSKNGVLNKTELCDPKNRNVWFELRVREGFFKKTSFGLTTGAIIRFKVGTIIYPFHVYSMFLKPPQHILIYII